MYDQKRLPEIENPEKAKEKMKQAHISFVDCASKFIALASFYSDEKNKGRGLDNSFQHYYDNAFKKLKAADGDDVAYEISYYAILPLSFIEDIKENVNQYVEILKGQDPSLTDYEKSCDLLAIRDTFVDIENDINSYNRRIAKDRNIDTHYNDSLYDPNYRN